MYRHARYKGYDVSSSGDLSGFTDSPADWALAGVRWAVGKGLLQGVGSGALGPAGSATRAQAATLLQRFIEAAAK